MFLSQSNLIIRHSHPLYLNSFHELYDLISEIPSLRALNSYMNATTGWELIPCKNLIKSAEYYNMLSCKKFPTVMTMRPLSQINQAILPDFFHEVIGHFVLLNDPLYSLFFHRAGLFGSDLCSSKMRFFSRFIWHTTEALLIKENNEMKVIGAAILSSKNEILSTQKRRVSLKKLNLYDSLSTQFNPYVPQDHYFYLESIDSLISIFDNPKKLIKEIEGVCHNNK